MGQMANSVVTLLSTLASRLFLCQDLSRTALPFCQYVCNLRPFCKKKKKKATSYSSPFSQVEGWFNIFHPRFQQFFLYSVPTSVIPTHLLKLFLPWNLPSFHYPHINLSMLDHTVKLSCFFLQFWLPEITSNSFSDNRENVFFVGFFFFL